MPITFTIHIHQERKEMVIDTEALGPDTATWGERRAGGLIKKAIDDAQLILMRENRNGALIERKHPRDEP